MSGVNRVCYPTAGVEVTVAPDGSLRVSGIIPDIQAKYTSLIHIPNVTHVTSQPAVAECIQLLRENATDIIAIRRPPPANENHLYHVPIQTDLYVNQIVSGYNYSHYLSTIEHTEDSATTLFSNFTIYHSTAVGLIFLFLLSIFLTYQVARFLGLHRIECSERHKTSWRKRFTAPRCSSSNTCRLLLLSAYVSFFFLSAPFLARFSTDKVVTNRPEVISSYSQVIEKKAKIFMSKELVDEYLLKPSDESIKRNNIHAQMYRYLQHNSLKFSIPTTLEKMSQFDDTAKPVQAGKAVMFAANYISDGFSATFCSWTNEGTLVQTFIHTDAASSEMLTGYPFRRGFYSPSTVKRFRRLFEGHLFWAVIKTTRMFTGFEFKRDQTSPKHRLDQRILCLDEALARGQKTTNAPSVKSFSLFFLLYFSITSTIFIIRTFSLYYIKCQRAARRRRDRSMKRKIDHKSKTLLLSDQRVTLWRQNSD